MNDDVRNHIAMLLSSPDPDQRRLAAEDLATIGGLQAVSALASALKDEDKGVRDASVRTLKEIGGERVARAIVENICDANIVTRNLTGDLLMHLGKESIPALTPYLTEADHDVRKFAVDILGIVGDESLVPQILPLLKDYDANVVVSAVEALGNLKSKAAVKDLLTMFEQEPIYRPNVAEALTKIADPDSALVLFESFNAELSKDQHDPILVFMLAEALGNIGDPMTLEALDRNLDRVTGVQRTAFLKTFIKISERIGTALPHSERWRQFLIDLLLVHDEEIMASVVGGLSRYDDHVVTKAMAASLGVSEACDEFVIAGLVQRSDAFAMVINCLGGNEATYEHQCIRFLGVLAENLVKHYAFTGVSEDLIEQAFTVVAQRWETASEDVRSDIIRTLFALEGDKALQFIDRILGEPDPWLRMRVIEYLASMRNPQIPALLMKFLSDENEMVREVAAGVLNERGFAVDPIEVLN